MCCFAHVTTLVNGGLAIRARFRLAVVLLAVTGYTSLPVYAQDLSYITAPSNLSAEDDAAVRQMIARLNGSVAQIS
jgi:hypothetical protein